MKNCLSRITVIILLSVIFLFGGSASAEIVSILSNGTRIREKPDASSEMVDSLDRGDTVEVIESVDNDNGETWFKVEYGEDGKLTGYVRSDLVTKGRIRFRTPHLDLIDKLELPKRDKQYYLYPTLVEFRQNRRFAVFSGPGRDYIRGQEIAVVSTNGKIQVFGYENNWVLVQYSIMGMRLRIGYIDAKHLPEQYLDKDGKIIPGSIPELDFAYRGVTIKEDTDITDDPLLSQQALVRVKEGTQLWFLGYLEGWAYVEYIHREKSGNVTKVRGFVKTSLLSVNK
ncbi:MAG: SH3 domain-containing protein [Clostridia bacterium]|nr:SH3 domain-containing protein [Clostridia bacterium]